MKPQKLDTNSVTYQWLCYPCSNECLGTCLANKFEDCKITQEKLDKISDIMREFIKKDEPTFKRFVLK